MALVNSCNLPVDFRPDLAAIFEKTVKFRQGQGWGRNSMHPYSIDNPRPLATFLRVIKPLSDEPF